MIARDLQKLIQSLVRMLFYLTPILWNMNNLHKNVQAFMNFNPIYYIVNGYRDSLLYERAFYTEPLYALSFWGLVIILAILGVILQSKFKNKFIDML
jgi:teichoic acid transport system permease protein